VFVVQPAGGPPPSEAADKAAVVGGRVSRTGIKTGARIGELVRVEGLAPGTRVVVNPPASLADGALVAPAKR
jgi:hypothetical protein